MNRRTRCASASLMLLLGSCTYWEPYPRPAPAPPSPDLPSSLRATSGTGPSVLLVEPFVGADTLYGRTGRDTIRIPLSEVRALQRQRVDGLRTTGLVLGVTVVWTAVALYAGGLE